MTNSEIFTAAHKTAKKDKYNFGTYAQRFASALKALYLSARINKRITANRAKKAFELKNPSAKYLANVEARKNDTFKPYYSASSWQRAIELR